MSCVSSSASCRRSACACSAIVCAAASASARAAVKFFLSFDELSIFVDALLALCRGRGALLLNRLHAPFQIGKQPVDALERRLRAAPPLFQARQLRGHLRSFLLQALALLAQNLQLRLLRF